MQKPVAIVSYVSLALTIPIPIDEECNRLSQLSHRTQDSPMNIVPWSRLQTKMDSIFLLLINQFGILWLLSRVSRLDRQRESSEELRLNQLDTNPMELFEDLSIRNLRKTGFPVSRGKLLKKRIPFWRRFDCITISNCHLGSKAIVPVVS